MVCAFIKMRMVQLYRQLNSIGLVRMITLIMLAGFLCAFLFIQTSGYPGSLYVTVASLIIILLIQVKRQDKLFLKSNFIHDNLICFVEYLLISIPVLILLIFHFQWPSVLILLPSLYLVTFIDVRKKQITLNTRLQRYIPHDCYEWKSGIRQTFFILFPLWLIGLFTAFLIWTVPLVLFIYGLVTISFYEKIEPYQMILAFEMSPGRFLFHKMKTSVSLFLVPALPLVVVFIVFHYGSWFIPVIILMIFASLQVYLILVKYAFYQSGKKSAAGMIYGSFGALCGIIPVFLPVVWICSVYFLFKARERLNFYLNDYH